MQEMKVIFNRKYLIKVKFCHWLVEQILAVYGWYGGYDYGIRCR